MPPSSCCSAPNITSIDRTSPGSSPATINVAPLTAMSPRRVWALARLAIPNVPSIQVDWALYGPKLAQVALTMGADDLDGVSASDAAPEGRRRAPLAWPRKSGSR